jgi:hypothetical protein
MKKFVLILLFLTSLYTFSQSTFNSEDFKVTRNDLETNIYIKDTTASALVLYESGNSYVDRSDFDLRTEEKYKIKILNREGFDKANITVHLYNNENRKEEVKNIIATSYNLVDGKIVRTQLKNEDIFEEKYDENYALTKFTLPDIKEGSVITYSYTLISPFMFKYKGWRFQTDIPKLYSEYRASIPGNWEYNIKLVGNEKLITNTYDLKKACLEANNGGIAHCGEYLYAMKDIPAFIEEDYMTSESNYLARIEYELKTFRDFTGATTNYTKTWETVDKEFKTDKDIGRQLRKSISLEEFINSELVNEIDNYKKAMGIYKFVQEKYTWNGDYKIFEDVSIKDLIKNKSGNVSSINILLHNLLKESGINVKPVLMSTRNNGFPTKIYPVISDFNCLIVQAIINDKTYLLDATDKYLSFGEIPFSCLNNHGRLMDFENGSEWIEIEPSGSSIVYYNAELQIDKNETITGSINSNRTGYHGFNHKKSYYQNKDAYLEKLENNYPYIEISDFDVTSEGITSPEFKESYKIEYNYDKAKDNIYLNPFFVKFFNENPFKLQERTYPIDFGYKDSYIYTFKLNFNENYTIIEKPTDAVINLPNKTGQIHFSATTLGNSINVIFRINFNEAIYPPEYYPYLKEFMKNIVDIQTNSLILLKKK